MSVTGDDTVQMTTEDEQEFKDLPGLLTLWKRSQEEKIQLIKKKNEILEQIMDAIEQSKQFMLRGKHHQEVGTA